jgi:hypothetical protein
MSISADLPVQLATRFEFVINLKPPGRLGLKFRNSAIAARSRRRGD